MNHDFESWLDAVRINLYEGTKELSNADAAIVSNDNAKRIAAQYGIRIVQSVTVPSAERDRNTNPVLA